jgi:hypothetical protein
LASTASSLSRTRLLADTGSPGWPERAAGPPRKPYTELETVMLPLTDEMT